MRIFIILIFLLQISTLCWGGMVSGFFKKTFQKAVKLTEGSFVFNFWKDPADVPIFFMVRFFNVSNPNRVLRGERPVLQEVGPYVYKESRENDIEGFSPDNETVTYRMKTTFTFQPDYSKGTEDDVITTLNVPYIVVVEKASNLSYFSKFLVREILANNEERLFVRKTVGELLFDGYYQETVAAMSDLTGEELLPNNTFGFFYGKNATLTDLLEIYTGVGNETRFGQTKRWEGQSKFTYWDNEKCDEITGSDGAVFSPWLTRNTTLQFFSPDMCRVMYLTYLKDKRITGIKGYKFVVPREVLASPGENPENECFCKGGEYGPCLKTGAMRLAPCRNGVPVVVSWPHFYLADPVYVNQSIGLQPNTKLHETFVILEPYTGLIRRGSKRFQVNMELKTNRQFRDMRRVPSMLFPIFWVEESKISRYGIKSHFDKILASANSNNYTISETEEELDPISSQSEENE